MYENRKYIIFDVSEINSIDFNCVLETSPETLRKSIDDTKTFVKWGGSTPSCIDLLNTKEGPYTHSEILEILSSASWTGTQSLP
jgi:hypothetical protein